MHSKTHLICLAAGLRPDPLGRQLKALARPQFLRTENGWNKKEGMRKNKKEDKSIVVHQNLTLLSLLL